MDRISCSFAAAGVILIAVGASQAALPVTHGLTARFDAAAITGLNDGDLITTWTDTSPSGGYDGTAVGYYGSPAVTYQTNVQNGLPAIQFANDGEWFAFPTISSIRQVYFVGTETRAERTSMILGQNSAIDWHTGGPTSIFGNYTGRAGNWTTLLNGTLIDSTTQRFGTNTPFVLSIDLPDAYATWANRLCADRDDYPNRSWKGNIHEVLIYTEALTPAEQTQVTSYLAGKWGLAVAPEPATMSLLALGGLALLRRRPI